MKKTNLSMIVVFIMLLSVAQRKVRRQMVVKILLKYLYWKVWVAPLFPISQLNNFDISRDGKNKLTVVNEHTVGKYSIRFTLSALANDSIVEEFVYNSPGLNAYCKGYLSFDNSHILVLSNDKADGITILKRNGEFVGRILDIISLAPPYTSGSLLKEMNY